MGQLLSCFRKIDLREVVLHLHEKSQGGLHGFISRWLISKFIWKFSKILALSYMFTHHFSIKMEFTASEAAQVCLPRAPIQSLSCMSRGSRSSQFTQDLLDSQGNSLVWLKAEIHLKDIPLRSSHHPLLQHWRPRFCSQTNPLSEYRDINFIVLVMFLYVKCQ